jgi:hypothetical protein
MNSILLTEHRKIMNWRKTMEYKKKYYQDHILEINRKAREKNARKKAEFIAFCEGVKAMRRIEARSNAIISC